MQSLDEAMMDIGASSSSSSSSSSGPVSFGNAAGLASEKDSSTASTASTSAESQSSNSPYSEEVPEESEEPKGSVLYRPMGAPGAVLSDSNALCLWEPTPRRCNAIDLLTDQARSLNLDGCDPKKTSSFDFASVRSRAKSAPSYRQRRPPPLHDCFIQESRANRDGGWEAEVGGEALVEAAAGQGAADGSSAKRSLLEWNKGMWTNSSFRGTKSTRVKVGIE